MLALMSHHAPRLEDAFLTRRDFLCRCGMGMGGLSLASLFGQIGPLTTNAAEPDFINPLAPRKPHFAPKAKRVIHFFLNGGPSHIDTFDPKPALEKYAGQAMPGGNLKTERKTGGALPSVWKFRPRGKSGLEISDLFPTVANSCADDLC